MLVGLIGLLGISNLLSIPKESSPDIKFGIVQIVTTYSGVAPEEIDTLITSRIEKEIRSIQGIDTMESSSREGFSSIGITLAAEADTEKVIQQIKDGVAKAKLPTDATEPSVTEVSIDSQQLFSVFLANTNKDTPRDALIKTARDMKKQFEGKNNIESVTIDGGDKSELEVIISADKLQALGITTTRIAEIIRSYNQSFPLGSFTVDTKNYDLRIEGDIESFESLLQVPISLADGGSVPLGNFATIKRTWSNTNIERMNIGEYVDIPFVRLNFNKEPRKSIFATSDNVRKDIEEYMTSL